MLVLAANPPQPAIYTLHGIALFKSESLDLEPGFVPILSRVRNASCGSLFARL
jgi:hypothetical protein